VSVCRKCQSFFLCASRKQWRRRGRAGEVVSPVAWGDGEGALERPFLPPRPHVEHTPAMFELVCRALEVPRHPMPTRPCCVPPSAAFTTHVCAESHAEPQPACFCIEVVSRERLCA